jgi:hypothetical protein
MNFIARPADPSFEAVAAAVMLVLATCANA